MKHASPGVRVFRPLHAVAAAHALGVLLISIAYGLVNQQMEGLTRLTHAAATIRVSIERSTTLLQQPSNASTSTNQRSRTLAALQRARLACKELEKEVGASTEPQADAFATLSVAKAAAQLAQHIDEAYRDIELGLHNPQSINLLRWRLHVSSLRRQLNALDDSVSNEVQFRRSSLFRIHALIMLGIGVLGSIALWSGYHLQRLRLRARKRLKERDDQLQALVGAVPDVVALLDADLTIRASSSTRPAWRLSQTPSLEQDNLRNVLDAPLLEKVNLAVSECIQFKRVVEISYTREIDGQTIHFDSRCSPLRDREQVVWVSWDISARVLSERRAKALGSHYNFLSHVNQAIVWIGDTDTLIQRICSVATQHGDFAYAWFATRQAGRFGLHAQHLVRASGAIDDTQHVRILIEHVDSPITAAFTSREVVCMPLNDLSTQGTWRAHLIRLGLSGLVLIPVRSDHATHAATLGILVLHSKDIDAYDSEHRALLDEIAGDIGYAIGRIRRDEERQQMAGRVRLHAAALEATRDGVMVTNPQGIVLSVNPAFTAITGVAERDAIGKISFLKRTLTESGYPEELIESAMQADGFWKGELLGRLPSGRMHTLGLTVSRVLTDKEDEDHRVVVFSDLTQQREDEARLRRVAQFDPLTGLPNRSLLLNRLEHALMQADQQRRVVALLYVDLDSFRTINDSLGHHLGDELLRQVALRLAEHTPAGCTLARLGGDEFAMLAEDLREAETPMRYARALHDALNQRLDIADFEPVYLQASIGICVYPQHRGSASDLIRNAELAMFEAKRAGRNTIRFFTDAMGEAAIQRLAVETRLRRALALGEFVLHYQPLWSLGQDRLVGVEALVRLKQPNLPPLGPAEFIPVLEDIGQIEALGDWVTREACRQARQWLDAGWEFGVMAINLSPVEVARHPVEQRIRSALDESGLPPERIELEITESGLMEQGARADEFLRRLHALGVRIAIDDFGTGYSSLAYLRRFPVNKLKIDRGFISELTTDERNARLVDSILQLGHSLGIEMLAEGVETEAQARHLRSHGCHTIQGYFISPPLPADQLWERYARVGED